MCRNALGTKPFKHLHTWSTVCVPSIRDTPSTEKPRRKKCRLTSRGVRERSEACEHRCLPLDPLAPCSCHQLLCLESFTSLPERRHHSGPMQSVPNKHLLPTAHGPPHLSPKKAFCGPCGMFKLCTCRLRGHKRKPWGTTPSSSASQPPHQVSSSMPQKKRSGAFVG